MPTPLRSRRRQARKVEPEQQILYFRLQQQWFALPVKLVGRVIPVETLYGTGPYNVPGFVLYQDQEIPVIDIYQRIFGEPINETPTYLILVQNLQGEVVGLPLAAQPFLKRIVESTIAPLSSTYLAEGGLRCVAAMAIPVQGEPPMFLIDLSQLLQLPTALPFVG